MLKKIKLRKNKKIYAFILSTAITLPFFVFLTNCGSVSFSNSSSLIYAINTDPFLNTTTVMNPTFTDATSAGQFFSSTLINLVSWRTTGEYQFDANNKITNYPKSELVMEGSKEFAIYDSSNTLLYSQKASDNVVVDSVKIAPHLSNAYKVEFSLNENLKWVDINGNVKQNLVPKDFLYGLISYYNSSQYGLNPNAYYMSLSGLDYNATINDVNNQSITPGGKFTYYLTNGQQTPFLFDILSKQYFCPVPYSNPEVEPTVNIVDKITGKPYPNSPIKFTSGGTIDKTNTNWNGVFNSGPEQQTNPDGWFVGSYFVNRGTYQDIVYNLNSNFFDATQTYNTFGSTISKIPQVVLNYGNTYGTFEKMYRSYTTNDLNYVKVQNEQLVEAYAKYRNTDQFHQLGVTKNSKTNIVVYNSQIYNSDGTRKSNIGPVYEKFINSWSSQGVKIRKALSGAINYPKLSEIVWGIGNYDLTMSVLPYGNELVKDSSGNTISQYQAIVNGSYVNSSGTLVNNYNGTFGNSFQNMINGTGYVLTDATSQQLIADMNSALDAIGASQATPLELNYYTLITSFSPTQLKYNEELINAIKSLSNGRIVLNVIPRSPQTVQAVYYDANSPVSNLFWSGDYSQASTFLTLYFELNARNDGTALANLPKLLPSSISSELNLFTGPYHVSTLWAPLYEEMKVATSGWLFDLRNALSNKNVFLDSTTGAPKAWDSSTLATDVNANILATQIGIWSSLSDQNVTDLCSWIDNQSILLPYVQEGLYYRGVELWQPQFKIVHTINGNETYRDYFYIK